MYGNEYKLVFILYAIPLGADKRTQIALFRAVKRFRLHGMQGWVLLPAPQHDQLHRVSVCPGLLVPARNA